MQSYKLEDRFFMCYTEKINREEHRYKGAINYAVHTADQSESPEGEYTLLLQADGSPAFFSSADGRLVLKEGKKKITVYKFVLSDDGGSVRSDVWQVLWKEDHVEVIISGEEQDDELIQIYYDGEIHSEFLHTRFGTFP